jgi:uncharacterized protein
VILIDANILIYSYIETFRQHEQAREWLDRQLNAAGPVGLPWPSLPAFLRLATNPRLFGRAVPMEDAFEQVSAWLDCATVWTPQPTERHAEVRGQLLAVAGVHANLAPDAHLAALAIEHGLTLCSTDGVLPAFPGCDGATPWLRSAACLTAKTGRHAPGRAKHRGR